MEIIIQKSLESNFKAFLFQTVVGGLNLIYNALFKAELPKFIDHQIDFRGIRAEYSYSDIVLSLLYKIYFGYF